MLYWELFFALMFFFCSFYLKFLSNRLETAAFIRGEEIEQKTSTGVTGILERIPSFLQPIMPGKQSMEWVGKKITIAKIQYTPEQVLALGYATGALFAGLTLIICLTYLADRSIILAITVIGGVIGFSIPLFYVDGEAKKAIATREREILSFIQQLKILAKSGVGTSFGAIASIVSEDDDSLLSSDFREALHEAKQSKDRKMALLNMVERSGSDTVREVISLILDSEAKELPLHETLEGVEENLLNKIEVQASDAQAKAEDRMAIPLAAMLLPANLILLVGPGIITARSLFSF